MDVEDGLAGLHSSTVVCFLRSLSEEEVLDGLSWGTSWVLVCFLDWIWVLCLLPSLLPIGSELLVGTMRVISEAWEVGSWVEIDRVMWEGWILYMLVYPRGRSLLRIEERHLMCRCRIRMVVRISCKKSGGGRWFSWGSLDNSLVIATIKLQAGWMQCVNFVVLQIEEDSRCLVATLVRLISW